MLKPMMMKTAAVHETLKCLLKERQYKWKVKPKFNVIFGGKSPKNAPGQQKKI